MFELAYFKIIDPIISSAAIPVTIWNIFVKKVPTQNERIKVKYFMMLFTRFLRDNCYLNDFICLTK